MDNRQVQEHAADRRQDEVVRTARDTRARVLEGLDALDRELQKVRREVESLPPYAEGPRRRWLPW
jgi:predicted ribonuclease toxin of YeeF-YezG toxin-antitoxin module